MRTSKTKNTTLQWHTGRPAESGIYLVAIGRIEDGRYRPRLVGPIYHLYELPYSATHDAWNCYDEVGAPDDNERAHWDKRVRYWAYLDNTLETLNAEQGG